MNEYRDQVTWYEVQVRRNGRWVTLSDHGTRERAERVALPGSRVVRRSGLPR